MPFAWWELVLILLVLLLVFGAKRLPEMGRSLGKGMREFKDSVSGIGDDRDDRDDQHDDRAPRAAELPASPSEPTPAEHDTAEKPERETVR
jgi:sec-independent protein translocase protein TatA